MMTDDSGLRKRAIQASNDQRGRPVRPRAHSYHPSSPRKESTSYGTFSSYRSGFVGGTRMFDALDLSGSIASLRWFLLGKIDEAERSVRELQLTVESESELDDEDDIQVTRSRRTTPDMDYVSDFIERAKSVLRLLKDEMPSAHVSLELSDEAKKRLDDFAQTASQVRERFSDSKARLIQNVDTTIRSTFATLGEASRQSAESFSTSTTDRFTTLKQDLTHLKDEASSLIQQSSTAAIDEAARLYHLAVEKGRRGLLLYHELPDAWQNNEHILTGYRYIEIERWGSLLLSGFQWHNETINIQSHFIGFLSLVYLLVYVLPLSPHVGEQATATDTFIAVLFIGAGMKCLLCSTVWHLFSGCAHTGWFWGAACVDYVGISGLIAASVMAMEYYGFYCRQDLARAYMVFTAVLGIAGMILPWQQWFNQRRNKGWRIAFFVGLAMSALAPLFHMACSYGFVSTVKFYTPVVPSVSAYVFGLLFYANHFPECARPGKFDKILHSHQVWHVSIVAALWAHWRAMNIWAGVGGSALSCAVW